MSRPERVLALLDLLREREETNVASLAAELNVSGRTVLRDLAILRDRGIAISSDVGPGGGIRLERDRGAAQVFFADEEIVALWLTANLVRMATNLPWSGAARAGLGKLFASLPRSRARELKALCRRVVVGKPASETVRAGSSVPPPELLTIFERAFTARVCMTFDYRDRHGETSARCIEPHGILVELPVWYILARDCEKDAPRMFRMDRITRPHTVPGKTFKPDEAIVHALTEHVPR